VAPAPNLQVYNHVTPNSETLLRLYAEADIFVFPTLADCAPLSVPEAMAAALPVVTTDVGAIPEMVRDGEQGFIVRPGDADALAAAILRLVQSPELRARMGEHGRRTAEGEYDAARNAQRLLNVLKGATDRAHQLTAPASPTSPATPAYLDA
jgi:glycosyltransferase involved in cell wall biosynthesis